ncbi:MAG: response regulator transcription factor [Acidobacteria bacterium]|nr:response regulator transcription factor [Acidobacteriota bacterium]MBI3425987.1 response regulator transcription factor [Acidobacteriota bacterium]
MRVLVIEDETKMADLIRRGLEEEGMQVELAFDGDSGLAAAQAGGNFDVIILDLGLPNRDGLEVAQTLRNAGNKTAILILTAQDSTEMKVKGLDTGADDYLTKPFAFSELVARLRALARRAQAAESGEDKTRLQIGDLSLNLINRKATRAGIEVQLTGKEFALLEYFMRHPDEILSRETLSEKVWEETFDTLTNVIDVYINYLRNKVDRQFEPKLIHTVRGVGYQFKAYNGESRLLQAESKTA